MTVNIVYAPVATVKGGFWSQYGLTMSGLTGAGAGRRAIAKALSRKGLRALREVMTTLDGATAGSTALKTQGRIEANIELGGVRVIETETLVDAATVAGDVTRIEADINSYATTIGNSPPANLDGNPLGTR